jgi:hypothetical protein
MWTRTVKVIVLFAATFVASAVAHSQGMQMRQVPPNEFFINNETARDVTVQLKPDDVNTQIAAGEVAELSCKEIKSISVASVEYTVTCEKYYALKMIDSKRVKLVQLKMPD